MHAFFIIGGDITCWYMYSSSGLRQANDLFNDPVRVLAKAADDVSEGRGNLLEYGAVGLGGYSAMKGRSYLFGGSKAAAETELAATTEGILAESVGLLSKIGSSLLEGLKLLPLLLFQT